MKMEEYIESELSGIFQVKLVAKNIELWTNFLHKRVKSMIIFNSQVLWDWFEPFAFLYKNVGVINVEECSHSQILWKSHTKHLVCLWISFWETIVIFLNSKLFLIYTTIFFNFWIMYSLTRNECQLLPSMIYMVWLIRWSVRQALGLIDNLVTVPLQITVRRKL